MKGELNGLQALFLRECPYAYCVHCYAHRLQLALVALAKDVVHVS
jgi:putative ubiquitin-RnfH superfamily antitoxin RatB of RatAB toxin-antitoxin module